MKVLISTLWYRESWAIQLKYIFETKQENVHMGVVTMNPGPNDDVKYTIYLITGAIFLWRNHTYLVNAHIADDDAMGLLPDT